MSPPRGALEAFGCKEPEAERNVDRGTGDDHPLETEQRKQHEPSKPQFDDRAERVGAIHLAERTLTRLPCTSSSVMSGNVMPAQIVAGSMTARQMTYRAMLYPT